MKILSKDIKKGEVKVKVETLDDLWYLSQIIDPGDKIGGHTERKIKIGDATSDRNVKVVRKKMFLEIQVEKFELDESLRVLGVITAGPDDISYGSHHSFDVTENDDIVIKKEQWVKFQLDKLQESTKKRDSKILIIVFDREEAFLATLERQGIKHLTHLAGNVQKKDENNEIKSNFYEYLIKSTEEYDKKAQYNKIIAASPAFFKEELAKSIKNSNISKKILYSTCSSVNKKAFNEVLKRPEIFQALHDEKISQDLKVVDELLSHISKDDLAKYGFDDVSSAVNAGAVKILIVSSPLISKMREEENYEKLEKLMKLADSMKSNISVIQSGTDASAKLDGLGGIGAILRYQI